MARSCRVLASFLAQPLEGEAADRLEEAEPDTRSARIGDVAPHEALIDELDELIQHVAAPFDDGLGLLEIEAALEDGQVMQGALRRRWQQLMAPRDGAGERPLSIRHVPRARTRQRQVRGQSVANGRQRDMGDPGGRQLHTERQPVHERAHLLDDGPLRPRLPTGSHGTRPLDEQPNTRVTERVERIFLFARDAQRGAARDEDPGAWRGGEDERDVAEAASSRCSKLSSTRRTRRSFR